MLRQESGVALRKGNEDLLEGGRRHCGVAKDGAPQSASKMVWR